MPKTLQNNTVQEIDYAAILSQYVYSDDQSDTYEEKTISQIISDVNNRLKNNSTLKAAVEANPEIGDFVLVSQSSCTVQESTDGNFAFEHLIACTFRNPKTNDIYVVYRGTGDGKWVDNGDAMAKESSLMQRAAAEYFDSVVEDLKQDYEGYGKIIVAGHSKGGNLAQFVTMYAENGQLVDNCYSIDGQGFSAAAIEAFKKRWGSDYRAQIDKMYSINGQNDYVHDLGVKIIDENQTYFVKTNGDGFTAWHSLPNIISGGQLNWDYTEDEAGNKIYNFDLPQGFVGKFVKELSARMMALPEEELDDCAVSIMTLVEKFMEGGEEYKQGTGDRPEATWEEYLGLFTAGLPIVINTIVSCEEAIDLLEMFNIDPNIVVLIEEIQAFAEKKGIENFCGYISEDPLRLLEVYSSLDLSKKGVNAAVIKVLSAGVVAKFAINVLFPSFAAMVDIVATLGIVYLVANHICQNWDTICENIKLGAEWVKGEIVEFHNAAKRAIETGINNWLSSLCEKAEEYITKGSRVVNEIVDGTVDFWNGFKKQAVEAVKALLFLSNPILYVIASKVYRANKEPLRINVPKIKDCVDRMNRLASRVVQIDQRLDTLYWRLAQNNIEQGEGIFTSLANMFNLFRADLNVDEGGAIKRKARALTELYEDYEETEAWVNEHVPAKI